MRDGEILLKSYRKLDCKINRNQKMCAVNSLFCELLKIKQNISERSRPLLQALNLKETSYLWRKKPVDIFNIKLKLFRFNLTKIIFNQRF